MKKTHLLILLIAGAFLNAQTYSNGGLSSGTISKSGVAAPAGYVWSENQNDTGNTTETNSTTGYTGCICTSGTTTLNYFLADDFTVPAGVSWTVSSIDFYGYQTGYTGVTSPFNSVKVQLYNSDPSVAGATSVFGDDTTNRFNTSSEIMMYRIANSAVPAPGSNPVTNRKIWFIKANVATTLNPGTYWVKFQLQNSGTTANFVPPVVVVGSRGLPSFNAKQFNVSNSTWTNVMDAGIPVTAPDVPQDMPFVVNFTTTTLGTDEELKYDNRVQVYPNPASEIFRISNTEKMDISTIDVIDMSGRTVKTLKPSREYNVSDLSAGNYMLKINVEGQTSIITKLLKK